MANGTKHAVVEIADVKSTHCGHIFNFVDATNDYDNGCVLAKGAIDLKEYEVYSVKVPTTSDRVMLIASVPTIPEARTQMEKAEHNFYNKAGEVMRAYELNVYDRYAVSSVLFDKEPEAGNFVVVGEKGAYKVVDSANDEMFVAEVERIVTKGYGSAADKRVYLSVVKNG